MVKSVASRDKMRDEAVSRMRELGVYKETIRQFERDGLVSISEPPFGAFYWAEGDDLKRIQEFEKSTGGLVYTVVRSFTEMGRVDSFLFVEGVDSDWKYDHEDIKQGQVFAYVYNHDAPWCSEYGAIGVRRTIAGGLERTW